MPTYLGPAQELTLADGTVVKPGDDCTVDAATQKALEDSGHYFSDTVPTNAPQSASENLAEEGTTAEQQAAASGLGVDAQQPPPPPPAPPK
jgi:hypothetical protein